MAKPQSLDELIAKKAEEFANQISSAAAIADKEEEIRIEVEKQLAFIQRDAGVKLEGKHEFTVASGRVDSVYDRVIIEYKNPSSPAARIGPSANSPGAKKVVEQIKSRFYDLRTKYKEPLNTLFGVGLDGRHFIFVRYYHDKWQVQEPVEVTKHSAERFLWALFNLGTKGKRFDPEYLAGDFGSGEGSVASAGIKVFYDAIVATKNPKAEVFFSQWKILFGEVCGYDVDNPSDKIKKLGEFYGVDSAESLKPAELLFSVHTYYALFMKLLAAEIMVHFHKLPGGSLVEKMVNTSSAAKLKELLGELEAGGVFRHLGITNFLEGDLFAWYLPAWSDPIEGAVRKMVARLDQYNPGTLAEEPAESRDMLKKLYQQLFPKSVRHDLGEYYTPDWLAEHVLNEVGYTGDPDKRVLDPACGSGTFLVMAINRVRAWYEKNRETCNYDEGDLCKKILANVVGFDLNPLAVMAARTNYLIAIRDLVSHVDKVEIPVYLCDSILTPSSYGGLFAGSTDAVKELKTSAAKFLIPTEIATNRDDVARYAEVLEFCVKNAYEPKEFIQRCHDEGLPVTAKALHMDLYKELVSLDKANKNGVWARIIKNSFAPLFVGKVDFVAGNPPWVRWGYLPNEYRADSQHLWRSYGLFTKKGLESRMGTAELDLSMLFTYVCADVYLPASGAKLGFVITKEVFKSKAAGEGFRRFVVGDNRILLRPYRVDDMSALKPFHAANKTACLFLEKGKGPIYPVPYYVWSKNVGNKTAETEMTVEEASRGLKVSKEMAKPIDEAGSAWQTMKPAAEAGLKRLAGTSAYKARIGARVEPYGVYWAQLLQGGKKSAPLITNMPEMGKTVIDKVDVASVEPDYLFPALRGRDILRWGFEQKIWVFLLNRSTKREDLVSEASLKKDYPKTYAYLLNFRPILLKRANYWKFFAHRIESSTPLKDQPGKEYVHLVSSENGVFAYEVASAPFYSMFNIGPYTFAPYRVCWSRMTGTIRACVVSEIDTQLGRKIIIPTDTATIVPFENETEAHYFCALVNSAMFQRFIASFSSAGRGFGSAAILQRVNIPAFSAKNVTHSKLADLSKRCHGAISAGLHAAELERDIEEAVDHIWP